MGYKIKTKISMETRLTIARNSCKPVALTLSRIVNHKNQVLLDNKINIINEIYFNILGVINQSFVRNEGDVVKSDKEWKQISLCDIKYRGNNLFLWNINPIESLDSYLKEDVSYYTLISIIKNNNLCASLVYNIKDDIYTTAIRGEGARIENEKLRTDNSSLRTLRFICNNRQISEKIFHLDNYEECASDSMIIDVFKLINGEIDFLLISDFDLIRYQAVCLICKESTLIVDLSKTSDNKWIFLASKAKTFNDIHQLIR